MKNQVSVAVVGAGNRGNSYGQYALQHPGEVKIVAVAEPNDTRRHEFAALHGISPEGQFVSWESLLRKERLADGIIISTLDDMHVGPASVAMEKGYQLLLEKPISHNWEGTLEIARKAKETQAVVLVAHVLRYTQFYRKLKELLDSEIIGEVRLVDHVENIGYWHFAHSYVRGNWRNSQVAAPIILAKTCHDLDLLYWMLDAKCEELTSSASLVHFTSKAKPEGASMRCLDCQIEQECPYSARKIYLNDNSGWPVSVITDDLSFTGRYQALAEGPYGRCVYSCDNNVPDVQRVSMRFERDIEVNFALTAFSHEINRTTTIYGTHGELRADFEHNRLEIYRFGQDNQVISIPQGVGRHGGGDFGLMRDFVSLLGKQQTFAGMTFIDDSLESHIMAYAAEQARKEKRAQLP